MKKLVGILLVASFVVVVVVNNPMFSYIFATPESAQIVADHLGEDPNIDIGHLYTCYISAFRQCLDSDFYDYYTYDDSTLFSRLIGKGLSGTIASYSDSLVDELFANSFYDVSDDIINKYPITDPEFFRIVYQLALTHYYEPEVYYRLLQGYSERVTD